MASYDQQARRAERDEGNSRVDGDTYVIRKSGVLGEPDTGHFNVVNSLEDVDRGEVAGYNVSVKGDFRLLIPRISKKDYEALMQSRLPEVPGHLEGLLNSMQFMNAGTRRAVLARKKAVEQELGGGLKRVILVDRLPDALDEVDMLDTEYPSEDREVLDEELLRARRKTKKFSLFQALSDSTVLDKYDVGLRQLETVKRLAASNPRGAAGLLQDSMNMCQTDVNVRVTAGEYAKDKNQARNSLGVVCVGYKPTTAAVLSEVIGEELFMFGPAGADDWHVSGPLKFAREVSYVYWMVAVEGTTAPTELMALELVMLGINIYDGQTCAFPLVEYHAGTPGAPMPSVGISEATAALLSSGGRSEIEAMGDRLLPVLGADGMQMASAVRVTDLHILVNSHVLDADPMCTVGGTQLEPHMQLSRDLWAVKYEGDSQAWAMRDPRVGESVAICYVMGGRVSCSSPLTVVSVDETCVVTTTADDVVARMSGGALVALDDMAFLGVHSASTWTNLIAYRFGTKQFSMLIESTSESCFSRQSDVVSFAGRMFDHFKKRGLGKVFQAALDALEPVYVGLEQVGMAVRSDGYLYTACDANYPLRFGDSRAAYVMETTEVGALYRVQVKGQASSPVYRRNAVNFEKVFVVGCDSEPYMSSETSVMHVGPNARSFIIGSLPGVDKPVVGGLVMGFDGAVLGICGALSASTAAGLGYVCWPLPATVVKPVLDVRGVLAKAFPFLNLPAWSDEMLEEVFTHSSVGRYKTATGMFNVGNKPLANVGDNAAKAELYNGLREAGVPHPTWSQSMQSLQSNSKFAKVSWEMGYAQCLVVGPGAMFSRESKAYADLTEALLGAAYLVERRDVFKQLCRAMGILYSVELPEASGTLSPGFGEEASTSSAKGYFGVTRLPLVGGKSEAS